ncbi:MAG: hypothetical protein DWQ37_04020 [Planctomycetota bacterium]|nr:MAG: hypothetical protein DWQ37_04020 [Planctomycetota bacterium]
MSRRGSAKPLGIQMFPFLAVLICTMGALVVLLHAFARHGQEQARKVAEAKARASSADDELELEELEWRIGHLRVARSKTEEQLADERLKLAHIEDHQRRLEKKLEQMERAVAELDKKGDTEAEKERLLAELEDTERQLEAARDALADAQQQGKHKSVNYSIVPYQAQSTTRRRPIYIECRSDALILQPEGVKVPLGDFLGALGPGNPLAAAVRAQREYLARRARGVALAEEPYPLLLVRPDGIVAFYAARVALESWGSEFGYELIDDDWDLEFPEPDPHLAELSERVVEETTRRYRKYTMATRGARRRSQSVYRASKSGGFELAPGSGSPGDDWGSGGDDYGDRYRRGSGPAEYGDGGYADEAGDGDGFGREPGGQGLAEGGEGTGLGPDRGGDGFRQDSRAGGFSDQGSDPAGRGLADSDERGAGAGGELRDPYAELGGTSPEPATGSGFGRSGSTPGTFGRDDAPSGRYPHGSAQPPADRLASGGGGDGPGDVASKDGLPGNPNSPSDGARGAPSADGSRYGRGTSQQHAITNPGDEPNSGSGGNVAQDDPPIDLPTVGGSYGGSSAQTAASPSTHGHSASQASPSSPSNSACDCPEGSRRPPVAEHDPNLRPQHGNSTMPQQSDSQLRADVSFPTHKQLNRPRDWALPQSADNSVAASRPILVLCYPDRLVVVPDSRTQRQREIPLEGDAREMIDELVAAVWDHTQSWGRAGRGVYWKPTLVLEVKPGGAQRYSEIEALLQGSGLDVKQRNAPATAGKPTTAPSTR